MSPFPCLLACESHYDLPRLLFRASPGSSGPFQAGACGRVAVVGGGGRIHSLLADNPEGSRGRHSRGHPVQHSDFTQETEVCRPRPLLSLPSHAVPGSVRLCEWQSGLVHWHRGLLRRPSAKSLQLGELGAMRRQDASATRSSTLVCLPLGVSQLTRLHRPLWPRDYSPKEPTPHLVSPPSF